MGIPEMVIGSGLVLGLKNVIRHCHRKFENFDSRWHSFNPHVKYETIHVCMYGSVSVCLVNTHIRECYFCFKDFY